MDKLNIVFVLDDAEAPTMAALTALEALCTDPAFEVCGIVQCPAAAAGGAFAYNFVNAIDTALFARTPPVDAPNFHAQRSGIAIHSPQAFGDEDAKADVIIDFATGGAPSALRNRARYGVWRLTACDAFAGFRDTLGAAAADVALIRYADALPPRRIATAAYNVKISAARTAAYIREQSVALLVRELKRLVLTGAPQDAGPYPVGAAIAPNPMDAAKYAGRFARALISRGIEKIREKAGLRPGMFFLKYGRGDPMNFDPSQGADIIAPGNHYLADPFFFQNNGERFLFFEDYDYGSGRGHIGVGKFEGAGFSFLGPALQTEYHLSYPFVFRHDGEIYMMPETNQARRLEVWRCTKFPDQWTLCATALDGVSAADSVLFQHNGEFWIFTNIASGAFGDHCSELHLFRAGGPLLQDLTPHPLNPVVIDSRTARGGGRVFEKDGRIFRLSQDNSHGVYGYALNVMEINRLDATGYSERLARKMTPDFEDGLIGCHHGDFADGDYVIDARRGLGGRARLTR